MMYLNNGVLIIFQLHEQSELDTLMNLHHWSGGPLGRIDEIKNADINVIKDKARRKKEKREAENAQNLRLAKLKSRQADPVEILHL